MRRVPAIVAMAVVVLTLLAGMLTARGSGRPLRGKTIVVDAGHGGDDRGVCYFPDDLIEKEINLDMARRVQTALELAGARVVMTRLDDVFISLDDRAEQANQLGADLFLSLHVNRIPRHPECFGAQTFFFPSSDKSQKLAKTLQDELLKIDPENYRTALPGKYRVLRQTQMPGVIVEIGFMTNARDRSLIATDEYRSDAAAAVVAGVIRFFEEDADTEDLRRNSEEATPEDRLDPRSDVPPNEP